MMNFQIDSKWIEEDVIQIQNRFMSDPSLSDIEFKNKMTWVWTTLKSVLGHLWIGNEHQIKTFQQLGCVLVIITGMD